MPIAQSKLTAQGQISVPAAVRRKLGVGPGATIEWDEADGQVIVRKAGKYSFEDVRRELFRTPPTRRSVKDFDQGIVAAVREKHARR
jgi:AbrB family looped-hinge helix DNA binding protein